MMALGMNTNAIFYPDMVMRQELEESKDSGLTRIEISYYFDSIEVEAELYKPGFVDSADRDLNDVLLAINSEACFGHRVPMKDFLSVF